MGILMKELRTAVAATLALAALACCLYPLTVWILGQLLFPHQANGSLLVCKGSVVGSRLIGQQFSSQSYFHSRPSSAGTGYDASSSAGSNWGPLAQGLIDAVQQRVARYRLENSLPPDAVVPVDAVTASGSGLDPHISVPNALRQAPRIARARAMSVEAVQKKIEAATEGRDLFIFGEPRVNVISLNLLLDQHER
jgi:K+-transporting ATPase ATPase C chain